MKFASWNVNGLRARVNRGEFFKFYREYDPAFICLQEIKMTAEQKQFDLGNVYEYWNSGVAKGVSGTAIFSKKKAISVMKDMNVDLKDDGGRVIALEFSDFYLVTVYAPTGTIGRKAKAIQEKVVWLSKLVDCISVLNAKKPVILCGDMNIAHETADLSFPDPKSAGFTQEERAIITRILDAGFVDAFRYVHPHAVGCYSWVSNRFKNGGLRLDYFFVSEQLKETIVKADILREAAAFDHCPIILELDMTI